MSEAEQVREEASDQKGEEQVQERGFGSPFLAEDAPPVIKDPYAVPIEDINMIDGRLFQQELHWEHFRRLREEDPVHFNELPGIGRGCVRTRRHVTYLCPCC